LPVRDFEIALGDRTGCLFASDFLGAHLDRVVKVRLGGVDDVEIRLENLMQVMPSC
jgi:hypothetical protein